MNAKILEHIESYFEGDISRQELEQRLQEAGVTDVDEQVDWVRKARLAVEAEGLKDQLGEVFQQQTLRKANVRRVHWRRSSWLIAASIALLVIGYLVFAPLQPSLYEKYTYVDPGLPSLMSDADNYELADALTYYSEGNYQTAYSKLYSLYNPDQPNDSIAYYLGASLLYQDEADDARPYLRQVAKNRSSAFQDRAEWLLVLSYLTAGDEAAAREVLRPILSDTSHLFYSQAESLQEEIE